MNYLSSAQVSAMLGSLIVSTLLALWYYVPWSLRVTRRDALLSLLWLHVPRYVTLILFSAQRDGYPISNRAALEAVVGDVAGAAIALLSIIAIQSLPSAHRRIGIWFSWILATETTVDMIVGIVRKAHEPSWGKAAGVTWLILDFYIPVLMVSVPLLVWQLISRRNEALSSVAALSRKQDARQRIASA